MRTLGMAMALAALLGLGAALAAEEKPAVPTKPDDAFGPPKTARWEPMPDFTDEFEGNKLDAAKWHDHDPEWKGRQPGFFAQHNVTVSGGQLHITMRKEDLPDLPKGYHTFTCGAVQSTRTVLYGYFEAKCKAMKSRGSSAFWFYHSLPERWTEIDVFEIGGGSPNHKRKYHMNVHVFRTPEEPDRPHWDKPAVWEAPYDLADGYHVYALEWDKEKIAWYVDGVLHCTVKNTHWHQPLTLNFDSETMPEWFGLPEEKDLPSPFSIEYIRAWKKVADR